jgi:hypothetical protein
MAWDTIMMLAGNFSSSLMKYKLTSTFKGINDLLNWKRMVLSLCISG